MIKNTWVFLLFLVVWGMAGTAESYDCDACHDVHGGFPKPTFHTADKLICARCHTMHYVENHVGEDEQETNAPKYYSGFSAWCAACHGGFHGSEVTDPDVGDNTHWTRHPTDRSLGVEIADNYGSSYDWRYPIEDIDANGVVGATDEIFCLSCHRSHGTPYLNSTRGDTMQPSGAGTGCNKCHAKGS